MTETSVDVEERMICRNCGEELYNCDGCKSYFDEDDIIDCDSRGKHLCKGCYEKI